MFWEFRTFRLRFYQREYLFLDSTIQWPKIRPETVWVARPFSLRSNLGEIVRGFRTRWRIRRMIYQLLLRRCHHETEGLDGFQFCWGVIIPVARIMPSNWIKRHHANHHQTGAKWWVTQKMWWQGVCDGEENKFSYSQKHTPPPYAIRKSTTHHTQSTPTPTNHHTQSTPTPTNSPHTPHTPTRAHPHLITRLLIRTLFTQ